MRDVTLRSLSQAKEKDWLRVTKWCWHGCPTVGTSRLRSGTSAKLQLQSGQLHCNCPVQYQAQSFQVYLLRTLSLYSLVKVCIISQAYTCRDPREHAEQLELWQVSMLNLKLLLCMQLELLLVDHPNTTHVPNAMQDYAAAE